MENINILKYIVHFCPDLKKIGFCHFNSQLDISPLDDFLYSIEGVSFYTELLLVAFTLLFFVLSKPLKTVFLIY